MRQVPTLLALEDGTSFAGVSAGAPGTATGEACFNTSMTGYQEVLTDPSYHGQIVAMTAPHIGNTGVNAGDEQSTRPWVAGFVVRSTSPVVSSWRAEGSLEDYLVRHRIVAIAEVDTRRLTRHLRTAGAMRAALSTEVLAVDELVDLARRGPSLVGRDLASEVSTSHPYKFRPGNRTGGSQFRTGARPGASLRVAAYDFGLKRNILDLLAAEGCEVTVLPAATPPEAVLGGGFEGVFLSNGPGDPEPLHHQVATVRAFLGKVPVFGICLGHQVLALALGGRTFKLKFGHRGSNHPVRRTARDRVEITCQNHGFAVEPSSLAGTGASITHVNLNDQTVEGIAVPGVAFGVQYHPESAPGPHDSRYLFGQFVELIRTFHPADRAAVGA